MTFLRDREAKRMDLRASRSDAPRSATWTAAERGARQEVSTLYADLRGFSAYADDAPPESVFRALNAYLRVMTQAVVEEAGWVDKILGDAVSCVFGVNPSTLTPADQAVRAAHRIVADVRSLAGAPQLAGLPSFDVGIGIATVTVLLGRVGTPRRASFAIIGRYASRAARLEGEARTGEVLLDEATHRLLTVRRGDFSPREVRVDGVALAYGREIAR